MAKAARDNAKESDKVRNKTRNDTPGNAKAESVAVLNSALSDMIDVTNATRQAHWNVKGSHFYGLHIMFEKFYDMMGEQTDEVAERAVQLGGIPDGTTQTVGAKTRIEPYDPNLLDGLEHCRALADRYSQLAKNLREGIDKTDEAGDADTADLLTDVSREVDKALWMIEAHLQGKN